MLRMTRRFQVEATLGCLSAFLFVVTLTWSDWIEVVFGIDPDRGSGALEWVIVAVTALAALTSGALARAEWKRATAATD